MSIYKKASKQKLRVSTSKGSLSAEQLWDLSLAELDALAVKLEKEHEASGEKSFLATKTEKSRLAKLKFDLVLDILTTKVNDANTASKTAETKAHNQKILSLIANKKDEDLAGKTVAELEDMLK